MCRGDVDPERRGVWGGRRRRREKRGKKREGVGGGRGAETSRTGKITHFDGIKMSVFPSPYLHGDSAPLSREREGERERNHGFLSLLSVCAKARRDERVCSRLNRSKRLPDIGEFAFWSWSKVLRDDSPWSFFPSFRLESRRRSI